MAPFRLVRALLAAGVVFCLQAERSFGGTAGGLILGEGLEARVMALGDAATGAPDPGAVQLNPAAIAPLAAPVVSAFMKPEIAGQFTGSLGFASPSPFGALAGSLVYKMLGDYTYYAYDAATGTFPKKTLSAGSDLILAASYARPVFGSVAAGATFKLLHSSLLADYSANAIALDLGTAMPVSALPGASVGASFRNLGTGLKFVGTSSPIPMEVRGGGAYELTAGEIGGGGFMDLSFGIAEKAIGLGVGIEGTWRRMVSVRFGYRYGYAIRSIDVGFGVAWSGARLDYVLEPLGEGFGMNHGVSLSYRLGGQPDSGRAAAAAESVEAQQQVATQAPAPSAADAEYAEASRRYAAGDYDGAWAHAYAAIQADPSRADAWQVIGNCQLAKGDKAGALQSYRAALQLNPNNPALKAWLDQNP